MPGTPVEAFIQTGERPVLSYLVKPLHDQALKAFPENRAGSAGMNGVCGRASPGGVHMLCAAGDSAESTLRLIIFVGLHAAARALAC